MTPISAPNSVAAIATSERNSSVSRMIAIATPTSSPTGASCSEAKSIRMPRAATSTPPRSAVSAAASSASPSAFSISPGRCVADVDRREPAVLR